MKEEKNRVRKSHATVPLIGKVCQNPSLWDNAHSTSHLALKDATSKMVFTITVLWENPRFICGFSKCTLESPRLSQCTLGGYQHCKYSMMIPIPPANQLSPSGCSLHVHVPPHPPPPPDPPKHKV